MKIIFYGIIATFLFTFASTATAQVGMMGGYGQSGGTVISPTQNPAVSSALQDIFKVQKIDTQAQVDCSKVTDDQFETLGDSYMGVMLPNQQQHQAMDNMMGGEGSATLRQAHINMGRSYLGCWSNYNSGPVYMPMMGGYASGAVASGYPVTFNNGFGYPMMATWGGNNVWSTIVTVIFWILALAGLLTIIKWIVSKASVQTKKS